MHIVCIYSMMLSDTLHTAPLLVPRLCHPDLLHVGHDERQLSSLLHLTQKGPNETKPTARRTYSSPGSFSPIFFLLLLLILFDSVHGLSIKIPFELCGVGETLRQCTCCTTRAWSTFQTEQFSKGLHSCASVPLQYNMAVTWNEHQSKVDVAVNPKTKA